MKRTLYHLRFIAVAAAFLLPVLRAEELTVELDPAKTRIAFVVTDVLHTVRGTFQLKQGHITFDPATGSVAGNVVVDAASGTSGSATRDRKMTKDILEAQRYDEVRFMPTRLAGPVSLSNPSTVAVTGQFLIHGQAHEITIPMQIEVSQQELKATGKLTIPYVEWGMKSPSNFLLKVSDKVEVNLSAVGHLAGASSQR